METEAPKYYWWHGCDLRPFFAEVMAAGADNVRIEFHPDEGLLYVRPNPKRESAATGPVALSSHGHNFVHTCPPDCD